MNYNFLDITKPLEFNSIGKFLSPSPEYLHRKARLSNFELIIMTKGTLYLRMGEKKYEISEGQYLLLQPHETDFREGYHPSMCDYYWMHFSCWNYNYMRNISPNDFISTDHSIYLPTQANLSYPEKVLLLMRMLQDHRRSNVVSSLDYGNYLTTLILCEVYQQYISQINNHTTRVPKADSRRSDRMPSQLYNDVIDYIGLNLHKNLKVQDISEHFGYSAKHISLICKQHSGLSLKHYILKQKIDQAHFMLLDTNASVHEIAASLGFPDSHNFSRAFKNIIGMTPSECRALYGKRIIN